MTLLRIAAEWEEGDGYVEVDCDFDILQDANDPTIILDCDSAVMPSQMQIDWDHLVAALSAAGFDDSFLHRAEPAWLRTHLGAGDRFEQEGS